jgi:NADPH:quinone reductase-like Zn-dependent oxidoreductase
VKAVVHDRYGPPEMLRIVDAEQPVPRDDEVLVEIHAATVSRGDCAWRAGHLVGRLFTGVLRPKERRMGQDFAGTVVAAGKDVAEVAVGDRVFGILAFFGHGSGTHAEYVAVPESAPIETIPDGLSFDEAAALPDGALLALNVLRPAKVQPGQRILVYGASGAIGTAGVQLAKHFGLHVTAVCDTKHVELVRSLGADEVLDYTRGEDFTKNGETYDIVMDAVGKHSFRRSRGSLHPHGVYLPTDGLVNALWWLWGRRFGRRKVLFEFPRLRKPDVQLVKRLVESGEYRPVIDRRYAFADVVEAHRYVETGQKTGNVVLTVS